MSFQLHPEGYRDGGGGTYTTEQMVLEIELNLTTPLLLDHAEDFEGFFCDLE